jgi:sterol desaturase/sphingolipid hydroxylase (fatty acid hydroxylase superfamily)
MNDFKSILGAITDPILWLIQPNERVFWPFLLSSALIASAVLVVSGQRSPSRLLRHLLPRRIWFHRSALLDYKLMFVKAILRVTLFAPWLVSTFGVAAIVVAWLRAGLGTAPVIAMSPFLVGVLFTVATFLFDDWSRYMVHRLMHRVPVLWEFHKVHHSARVLTPFTLFRSHPVETFLNGVRGAVAIGMVTGVFYWLFGARVHGWQVLGVDAIGFVWTLFGANLRHSNVWISYGPLLEHVFNSPAQHQIHHSDARRHYDRNFGEILSIWDWLGGSLYVTRSARERIHFGLPPGELSHGDGIFAAVVSPIVGAVRIPARGLRRLATAPAVRLLVVLAAIPALSSCDTKSKIDRTALLRSFGDCALATYKVFESEAGGLAVATEMAVTNPSTKPAAQDAWRRAIDIWQQAELMQFGPAAAPPALGGQNLREGIYAWPDVNRCLIEQQIVARTYESADTYAAAPSNTRGLGAIEYLLFYQGTDNACGPTASINASGTWMALSADELSARKAAYARAAAADVAAKAQALVAAWEPGKGDLAS